MELALIRIRTGPRIVESGILIRLKAGEIISGQMGEGTKGSGRITVCMGLGCIVGLMASSILDNTRIIKRMGLESISQIMRHFSKGTGAMGKLTVWVLY